MVKPLNFPTPRGCRIRILSTCRQEVRALTAPVDVQSCPPNTETHVQLAKYRGVDLPRGKTNWRARVTLGGRQVQVGTFNNPVDAALAYDAAVRTSTVDIQRDFQMLRRLNFPTPEEIVMQANFCSEHRRRSNLERYGNNFLTEAASKAAVEQAICDQFEVHWLGEGTWADGICRPKQHAKDEWIGIQVKATAARRRGAYQFSQTQGYSGLLLVCVALDCMQLWMIPGASISAMKIRIPLGGKWDAYRCSVAGAPCVLQRAWEDCANFVRQREAVWNVPTSDRHQIEYLAYNLSKAVLGDAGVSIRKPFIQQGAVDMLLNGHIRVQAKARTQMSNTNVASYNITLRRWAGTGMYRRFASDEFDLLLVQLIRGKGLIGMFLIPMFELLHRGLTASGIPCIEQTCGLNLYPPWSSPAREKGNQGKGMAVEIFCSCREWH